MTLASSGSDHIISVYLTLAQYPTLAPRIRMLMRQELSKQGFLDPVSLNNEAVQRAIQSQEAEGLHNPLNEESAENWEYRKSIILDQLTDQYFAYNLPYDLLLKLVEVALSERGIHNHDALVDFNPEIAPLDMLFNQGMTIERLSAAERVPYEARLHEIKVVLIRKMISDQLRYINIAKDWFTISDLAEIRRHTLGQGRIGGKAAGMLLASRILKEKASPELRAALRTPVSFYVGSDLIYNFMSINNLMHWNDQKYKTDEQMRIDYPQIVQDFEQGEFQPSVLQYLETILSMAGGRPLIVRSSSLLEDNFGTAFAGKYDSIFVPNQNKPENNLRALTQAMARIYASTLNPAALQYRKSRGLLDYDERMALLIQVVEGVPHESYYFPQLAGVAFSRNAYRWSPMIRAEDGFLRLVWGLGTRAVDRVGNDYPRLVALSHPTLNPSTNTQTIACYSQKYVDLINLDKDRYETLPVSEVLNANSPELRFIAQINTDGYLRSIHSSMLDGKSSDLVLTFKELMLQTRFPDLMKEALQTLEREYQTPVDVEFTASVVNEERKPDLSVAVIQCRPLAMMKEGVNRLPKDIPPQDVIFSASSLVAGGTIKDIRYVVHVPARSYFSIKTHQERVQLERGISMLNAALKGYPYILIGPGRWGTSNPDLGIHVAYADIFNTKALVEVSGGSIVATEPSLGTHFFQDLLEGQIYPLAIDLDEDQYHHTFLTSMPNRLSEFIPIDKTLEEHLHLIRVSDFKPGCHIQIVMDDSTSKGLAFLVSD